MDVSLNPTLAIRRSLLETWQSFQGLGLLGGHGYNAQLPYAFFQFFASSVVGAQYGRYFFTFLMLLLGPLGAYACSTSLLKELNKNRSTTLPIALAATLGAFFYLLHLGTVQTFYVHLEPFILMYGLFPWLLINLFWLLRQPTVAKFLSFFLLNFALSMIGFIPPVFISYCLFLGVILATYFLFSPSWQKLKNLVMLGLIVLITNAYWLIPVGVFTLTQGDYYLNSKLNQATTQSYILTNTFYGQLNNVGLMKSFYFDSLDQNRFAQTPELEFILKPWINHLEKPLVTFIGYSFFLSAVLGLFIMVVIFFKRKSYLGSLGITGLITLSLLATGTPILSQFSGLIRFIPVLNQAFRIPFSKLSMSATFFFSLGFALFCFILFSQLSKLEHKTLRKVFSFSIFVVIISSFIYFSLPSFKGDFLYRGLRQELSQSQLALIDELKTLSPRARVLQLPMFTYSGWDMQSWEDKRGFTGSGYLWYTSPPALLNRAFDVWSPYNETLRNEFKHAITTKDSDLFTALLTKYEISHILIDESLYLPGAADSITQLSAVQQLTNSQSHRLLLDKSPFKLYQTKNVFPPVSINSSPQGVSLNQLRGRIDPSLDLNAKTVVDDNTLIYPFQHLSQETLEGSTLKVENNFVELSANLSQTSNSAVISLPQIERSQFVTFKAEPLLTATTSAFKVSPLIPTIISNKKELFSAPTFTFFQNSYAENPVVKINSTFVEIKANDSSYFDFSLPFLQSTPIELFDARNTFSILNTIPAEKCTPNNECFSISPSKSSQSATIRISYTINQNQFKETSTLCLVVSNDLNCLTPETVQLTNKGSTYDFVEYFSLPSGSSYQLVFPKATTPLQYAFDDLTGLSVIELSLISTAEVSEDLWNQIKLPATIPLPVEDENDLSFVFPLIEEKWRPNPIFRQPISCDSQSTSNINQSILNNEVTYSATNRKAICELITFPKTYFDQEYVVGVSGENISGKSLKLIINQEGDQYLPVEHQLPSVTFDRWIPLFAHTNPAKNISIIAETRSHGSEEAKNSLASIRLVSLPLELLVRTSVGNPQSESAPALPTEMAFREIGSGFYDVTGEAISQNEYLLLNQAFDKNWLLIDTQSPFKRFKHVHADNWKNAWSIPPGSFHFLIVFYPQLLVWFCYLLLILSLLLLSALSLRVHFTRKRN